MTHKNTPEQNKELIEKYPFLLPRYWRTGEPREDYDYRYTLLDMLPDGWRIAFCPQMLDELKALLIKANYLEEYRISDIKEKYGGIRWYDNFGVREYLDDYYEWLTKYTDLSEKTCIICGRPADCLTLDWISPFCYEHLPKGHPYEHLQPDMQRLREQILRLADYRDATEAIFPLENYNEVMSFWQSSRELYKQAKNNQNEEILAEVRKYSDSFQVFLDGLVFPEVMDDEI